MVIPLIIIALIFLPIISRSYDNKCRQRTEYDGPLVYYLRGEDSSLVRRSYVWLFLPLSLFSIPVRKLVHRNGDIFE